MSEPVRFGVNYTPRRGWFHSWLDLDLGEVREDLEAVAALGADHVRVFPLWPLLQPNRTLIRRRGVQDVADVAAVATECGLRVSVDVLQGHLSSFDFLPSWVQTWHARNLFTDSAVVAAQAALVRELAAALREIPGADGLCLGNEFVQFAASRHPDRCETSPTDADTWLRQLLGAAEEEWPAGRHVHSFDDDLWFDDDQPFGPGHAVQHGSATTVHSWIFGSVGRRYGPDSAEAPWFARWLCELADAWARRRARPGRPVWLQEVGAPLSHLHADAAPTFLESTVGALLGHGGGGVAPGLEAVTWWCSHDVSRELADFPELEHSLGLIDSTGRVKPTGEAFARAVRSAAVAPQAPSTRDVMTVRVTSDGSDRSRTSAEGDAFAVWVEAALAGNVRALELIDP